MNTKNQVIQIDADKLSENAMKYMKQLCGNVDEIGKEIEKEIKSRIKIKFLYSMYSKECIVPKGILLEEELFLINWKEYRGDKIEWEKVEKIAVYFLTIGKVEEKRESLLEKFYADGWKNAYLEAAREYSIEYIKKVTECTSVCDSFAPGIAGMQLEQMEQFFSVLKAEEIEVTYWKKSMLKPEKTLCGIYFLLKNSKKKYEKECNNCIGKRIGCLYCVKREK